MSAGQCRAAIWIGCSAVLLVASLRAADLPPLPEPLTLEAALEAAADIHPDLLLAQARREAALAARDRVGARYGLELGVRGRARWVDPSPVARRVDDGNNDSSIHLEARKLLYDFGQTRARMAAAEARIGGQEQQLKAIRLDRRLDVMSRFFDVKLADLEYRVQNEAMAIAFVRMDRLRERAALGQASDVELLELEARFQRIRSRRVQAEADQRLARARLAESLNRPGTLPGDLVPPRP